MDYKIQKLRDGRSVGCGLFEVVSFPPLETAQKEMAELEKIYKLYVRVAQEFHKLSIDLCAAAELIWITEKAENQTFRSRIRLFCAIRCICCAKEAVHQAISQLIKNLMLTLSANQYGVAPQDFLHSDLQQLLDNVCRESIIAVVKSEKTAGNATSLYPYYYCDVIPENNTDNFNTLIATLSQCEGCCISFQLLPTKLSPQEVVYLNEITGELGRVSSGFMANREIYRDLAASDPYRVLSYYQDRSHGALFLYGMMVFGSRSDCTNLAAKILSLLQAGEKRLINTTFSQVDISAEHVRLREDFLQYPWNLNRKMVYIYRRNLSKIAPMAGILFRIPYLVTAEEAASFFRLPMWDSNMTALRSNPSGLKAEQFDKSVMAEDNITIGKLLTLNSANLWIGCPENAFTKHALIVGTPGSGKTNFSINLLLQFAHRNIPFLAIEPTKTEYRAMIDVIPGLRIFTPGNNSVSPFVINPFIPPLNISIEQYVPSLANAFKAAFDMQSPLDILFLRTIRQCYARYGWKDASKYGDKDVTVFGLHEFILEFKRIIDQSTYSQEIKGNLRSAGVFRLMNLIEQNSNIYDTIHTVPIEDMLSQPTVLELNAIDNAEQKALIMALLLISICVYTKNNQISDGKLKNILLIDEAHVLLGGGIQSGIEGNADSQGTTVKALQDMIAEIRSYGIGILIADQSPTKVSREVVANTDIKISFRLVQASEKQLIADSTNMDEEAQHQLSRFKPGEAYVYYSRLEMPQMIITEDIRKKKGIRLHVPNLEIAQRMTYWESRQDLLKPYAECNLCSECKTCCDFNTRSKADFYASKMIALYAPKIKDEAAVKQYTYGVEKLLENTTKSMPPKDAFRLVNCTRIRFLRKLELEASFSINKAILKNMMI